MSVGSVIFEKLPNFSGPYLVCILPLVVLIHNWQHCIIYFLGLSLLLKVLTISFFRGWWGGEARGNIESHVRTMGTVMKQHPFKSSKK